MFKKIFKRDKEKFDIPKSVQDVIPIKRIWKDGIFEISKNKYSKTFKFTDINYAVASKPDQVKMFLSYSELLNSLDPNTNTQITIINKKLNRVDFEKSIMIPLNNDKLDEYRCEYNNVLKEKALDANSIIQDKYITISIEKNNIDEARAYFSRVGANLSQHFSSLGSKCTELNATDRLKLTHNFYRPRDENNFNFDLIDSMRKGHSFKDYICPDSFSFQKDDCEMGEKVGRVFFLKEYANYIRDEFVSELSEISKNLTLNIDIKAIPTEEAIRMGEKVKLGVETNITNWQRKQNKNNNFSAVIPYGMEQERKESKEFLDDITTRDQRVFYCILTICLIADDKNELDAETESLFETGRKHSCQIGVLNYQQMDGLNTTLPFGVKKINTDRTLITESLAVFMPFKVMEINHPEGIYYGENVISKNMIIADRRELLNGNSFILGVSGSGKSFAAKNEIISIALRDSDADVIIIDPEREYLKLVESLGGEDIFISATSPNHINAMDINAEYGEGNNPIILKSEFILSLCELLKENKSLDAVEKSIIDRCTIKVYQDYKASNYKGTAPTLIDLREELLKQEEIEAKRLATIIERFSKGTFKVFSEETNVNIKSRIICYDIKDLHDDLRSIGMLVILDNILNRITSNRAKGRRTYIFIDEIYLLFEHKYSANFLYTLWKRCRKLATYCTGITQNVEDLLQSHTARTMLANSEFLIMLNQASTDAEELARLLNISETQMSYITKGNHGEGLLKVGTSLIPFKNEFPDNNELYKLMSTKPGDDD